MKFLSIIFFTIITFSQIGFSQNQTEYYHEEFNWTIKVPDYFKSLDSIEIKNLGLEEEEEFTHHIFAFQVDIAGYFIATQTEVPFEILYDEQEEIKLTGEDIYQRIKYRIPDSIELETVIDTSYSIEWINHLEFKKFEFQAVHPNMLDVNGRVYLRQFGDQVLYISYFYNNPRLKYLIRSIVINSRFEYPGSLNNVFNPIDFQIRIPQELATQGFENDYGSNISLANPEEDILNMKDPHEIVLSDTSAILVIDYPGLKEWYFEISSTSKEGFSRLELVEIICQKYHQTFEDPRYNLVNYVMNHIYIERRYDGRIVLTLGIDS